MAPAHRSNLKPDWLFVTNHALVLIEVWQHPDHTIRSISERIGITERATHRILGALADAGYLERRRVGRRNQYTVRAERSMRHPKTQHVQVGRLLEALGAK